MRNSRTWCVVGVAALVAISSLANAQETTVSPAEQAQAAVFNAACELGACSGENCTRCSTKDNPQSCCGDAKCCSDPQRCAECDLCNDCNGNCKAIPGVVICGDCKSAVRLTPDNAARIAAIANGDIPCPVCVNGATDLGLPVFGAHTKSASCPCAICNESNERIASARPLPGAVSFLRENADELARQRDQMATELTEYLTSHPHDQAHVREVLREVLETTADEAHRAAMVSNESAAFDIGSPTVTPDISQLQFEMDETRRMIISTQQDLQLMNESLRFLARHMQQEQKNSLPSNRWDSRPTSSPPAFVSEMDRVRNLQEQVERLQREVQSQRAAAPVTRNSGTEQRVATSWNSDGKLRPAAWNTEPLMPKVDRGVPLRPVHQTADLKWRHYYVGDLIGPPVASSTLRLMQHIKSKIAPLSWQDESIQIAAPSVSLMILQTPENHQRIELMLREMGAMLR